MTQSDIQKYMKIFVQVDTDKDGKITGEHAHNLFLGWRLPREVLKQGWDLSDRDSDSMLSLKEFCVAVYLMERYREDMSFIAQFNGHYIIAVAFMSVTPISENPMLVDYTQSGVPAVDPDSDIIEGPSRISTQLPHKCFDCRNFDDINSRRPSWHCPHCNQPCCYTDICVYQNMAKLFLGEVGQNVNDVIISVDGSWKAVLESDENVEQTHERTVDIQNEQPKKPESMDLSTNIPMVLDLTGDDDRMFIDLDV